MTLLWQLNKKTIYLVPLRTLAEEKYRRFKEMYHPCGIDVVISSRDRKEDDTRIGSGRFKIAIMVYEKFYYFLLKYPAFLSGVSLVIIDEMQIINDPVRGPLLEEILVGLQEQEQKIKIIGLSAFLENQRGFLQWLPCRLLSSYLRPVELRKGIVREGVFKYITHNEKKVGEEVFFISLLSGIIARKITFWKPSDISPKIMNLPSSFSLPGQNVKGGRSGWLIGWKTVRQKKPLRS